MNRSLALQVLCVALLPAAFLAALAQWKPLIGAAAIAIALTAATMIRPDAR